MANRRPGMVATVGRGVRAGVAGTAVMTAFQKYVEMPLTGREESYAVAARAGLRGQAAVAAVFATVYTGDVLLNTALGLYKPSQWSGRDIAIDVVDKLVQAEATGAIVDRFLSIAPNRA